MKEVVFAQLMDMLPFFFFVVSLMILYVVLQMLLPDNRYLDELIFYACLLVVIPELIVVFEAVVEVVKVLTSMLFAFIPIIGSILLILEGPLSFIAWNPIVLAIIQFLLFVTDKLFLPLLLIAILLDVWSRGMQELPLTKMAQLIRSFLIISTGTAMLVLTGVLTTAGALVITLNDTINTPIKKTLEQAIPIVGSVLVQAISIVKKTQVITSSFIGAAAIIAFITTLSVPILYILLKALTYRVLSSISEPLMPTRVTLLFEDLSKSLFVLCGIATIIFICVVVVIVLFFAMSFFLVGRSG